MGQNGVKKSIPTRSDNRRRVMATQWLNPERVFRLLFAVPFLVGMAVMGLADVGLVWSVSFAASLAWLTLRARARSL